MRDFLAVSEGNFSSFDSVCGRVSVWAEDVVRGSTILECIARGDVDVFASSDVIVMLLLIAGLTRVRFFWI